MTKDIDFWDADTGKDIVKVAGGAVLAASAIALTAVTIGLVSNLFGGGNK